MWLWSPCHVASATKKLNFKLDLILNNLNLDSPTWLPPTMSDSTALQCTRYFPSFPSAPGENTSGHLCLRKSPRCALTLPALKKPTAGLQWPKRKCIESLGKFSFPFPPALGEHELKRGLGYSFSTWGQQGFLIISPTSTYRYFKLCQYRDELRWKDQTFRLPQPQRKSIGNVTKRRVKSMSHVGMAYNRYSVFKK